MKYHLQTAAMALDLSTYYKEFVKGGMPPEKITKLVCDRIEQDLGPLIEKNKQLNKKLMEYIT